MKKKTRKILLYIFTAIFVAALMLIAATNARYVSMQSPSSNSVIGGNELQYTIAEQYEVTNQNELKAAIENGYSNIKITSDEDEPFYVSGDDLALQDDLILDLNGHEIQCITREPIITVGSGNRLLVADTSESGTGSFYNPVGSVLFINGGTLSATSGKYESGPRKSEYYSNINDNGYTGGYILADATNNYQVEVTYQRETNGEALTSTSTASAHMPILYPNGNSGNVYFDIAYSDNNCSVVADTYLYLITADTAATLANSNKADFYYTYYLNYNESTGEYSYSGTLAGEIFVTVCGFYNDIAVAKNTNTTFNSNVLSRDTSNFAAIKMASGYLYVRGGSYYSYFGVSSAYCVSTTGGTIGVYDGFFEAIEAGVCVRCADFSALLYVYDGDFYSYKGNMVEVLDGEMTVTGGTFTKDATDYNDNQTEGGNNSAIYLDGGTMTVTGAGEAKADGAVMIYLYGSYMDGIRCESGTVSVTNAQFIYNGGSADASTNGEYNVGIANRGNDTTSAVTVTNCLFDTGDSNCTGIKSILEDNATNATGEKQSVTASGCVFVMTGAESTGIHAKAGTVTIGDAQDTTRSCMFYIDHVANCYGVYAEASTVSATAKITINVNCAQFIMGQQYYSSENTVPAAYTGGTSTVINGAGVYLNDSNGTLNLKRAMFLMAGSYTAGVYAAAGTITQDVGNNDYTCAFLIGVKHSSYNGAGISDDQSFAETKFGNNYFVAKYGSAYQSNTQYTALSNFYAIGTSTTTASTTNGSTAIAGFQFTECETTSAIGSYGMFSDGGTITADKVYVALLSTYGSGIYSEGGEITVNDFECDVRATDSGENVYPGASALSTDINSTAITVTADTNSAKGSVTVLKSNVNTDSYGYLVSNGSLIFGDGTNTYANKLVSARATAILITGGDLEIKSNATLTVTSNIATKDSSNNNTISLVDKSGDMLTNFNGVNYETNQNDVPEIAPDGIYISGGDLKSYGTLNMYFSGTDNDTTVTYFVDFVINSYAVRVTGDSSSTVTINAGAITSYVGGGVEVSASRSTVTLGASGADNTALTVETKGYGDKSTTSELQTYDASRTFDTSVASNWGYYLYKQSGHAVKVDNGTVTVNSGTYYATQGNGIYVNGSFSEVTINDGNFVGHEVSLNSNVGSAISYSVKLIEGIMKVYGGTFGVYNSTYSNGVFVMGTADGYNSAATNISDMYSCLAYFYGGTYNTGTERTITAMGYSYVQIGADSSAGYSGDAPEIIGGIYGVGLEPFTNSSADAYSYVGTFAMYKGSIEASTDGIWIGNKNYTIDIEGGGISGSSNGILFYREFYGDVTINAAEISGGHGIYVTGAMAGDVTITSSTIASKGAGYGIYFKSTVFSASGYTFTIDSSEIYGGSGIRFAEDTGTNGSFVITGTSKVYSNSLGYYGLEFSASLGFALTISGSAQVSGDSNHGIYIGGDLGIESGNTYYGSITVSGSAKIESSGNNKYDIYISGYFRNGTSITESSSAHTNTNRLTVHCSNSNNRGTISGQCNISSN